MAVITSVSCMTLKHPAAANSIPVDEKSRILPEFPKD